MRFPIVIQGGMGVAVSDWRLAKAVASAGQLGVVSGTGINVVLARRLQEGDRDGAMRRALAQFPIAGYVERILDRYFIEGGKPADQPYKAVPMYTAVPSAEWQILNVVASFVEVFLAKEGHTGVVGINLLEKVQMPNLSALYGAMLANVDYVLMGAGIPREIPGVLDQFAVGEAASLNIYVEQAGADDKLAVHFDPREMFDKPPATLKRPEFLAIIASNTLAIALAKKATGKVNGFIVEGPTAGGHNAPPRGQAVFNERGEPVYGQRDVVDLVKLQDLGLPFWLAGSYGSPDRLAEALASGAVGIQVGTAFALSNDSGFSPEIRQSLLNDIANDSLTIFTDALASPTGFPFKVAELNTTLALEPTYKERPRICDLGYLRVAYPREDGTMGFRCPAEPVDQYVKKGGDINDTTGRKCLCNALFANIGMPQQRKEYTEQPLVTLGDDIKTVSALLELHPQGFSAVDVLEYLLAAVPQQ
ncbi:MAG: nitronate monooxygenase [Chloroflexi bacterium]|nr:nitronate monooxygenase [Chloroflexota bacterium]